MSNDKEDGEVLAASMKASIDNEPTGSGVNEPDNRQRTPGKQI